LYPHSHGVTTNNIPLAQETRTLPELIQNENYKTAYIGKWHLGNETQAWHGFDQRISTEDYYTQNDTTDNSDYWHYLVKLGYNPDSEYKTFSRTFATNLPYEHSKSKFIENKAIEFLDKHVDQPFMLYLGFLEPHSPNNGPFNELHNPDDVELDSTYFMSTPREYPLRYFMKKGYTYPDETREVFAKYWGLVHQVDLSVGVLLQKLNELGLSEKTILVYTSEHGKMMRKFGLTGKTVMYEPSSRIPWMMRVPGVAPQHIDSRVSQIDLVPTLLELMGKSNPDLPGESLVSSLMGKEEINRPVFMEWNSFLGWQSQVNNCPDWATEEECADAVQTQIRTIVTQNGWKLNWSSKDKSQLFNLNDDPMEVMNLYYNSGYSNKVKELKAEILDWQKKTNDKAIIN